MLPSASRPTIIDVATLNIKRGGHNLYGLH
ncbi:hypothetical protein AZ044_004816 [Pluralibacter gergoviae]|nr:hypothetical protein AZ034_001484 [Pluralibacter gergoviae]OUF49575.1 hypothetical protein AZ044_004816 [Pluralibacter gergoviae]